jgi:Icc-related predicted phosphoesterase
MPRLAIIGDVHGALDKLELVLPQVYNAHPDGILMVGDLGSEGDLEGTAMGVLDRVSQLERPILFVPGNHDIPGLPDRGLARNVDHKVLELGSVRIWGIGGSGPNQWGFPYEWSDDMLRHRPRERADILLAHCPPLGATVDRTTQGKQAGSQAMRELLTEGRFELMVCGHIHEAPYAELVEGVPCVNAGALGAPFGAPQFVLVDWEPEHIGVRHIVLPYILQPETLPWLRGAEWGPDPGERHWRFERRA